MARESEDWVSQFKEYIIGIPPEVFNQTSIFQLFNNYKKEHLVPYELTSSNFITTLKKEKLIKLIKVKHIGEANPDKDEISRYICNSPSAFSIALSLRSKSYLSHNSALYLHGLTKKFPLRISVNKEQSPKYNSNDLTQGGIDRAFKNRVRQSQYIWKWKKYSFIFLNGKHTEDFGVINHTLDSGEKVRTTDLERTLVDVVVRPIYSGGTKNLIKIYRNAKEKVSTNKIIKTLKKLDYSYPYHQSIGFLMECAGYDSKELDQIRKLSIEYDFYLEHGIKNMKYDEGWRLYYPTGLK